MAYGLSGLVADLECGDPAFAAAFRDFAGLGGRHKALSPKMRELVGFALNAAVSHLNEPAAAAHALAARHNGASAEEMRDVARLTMLIGIHSVVLGADFLVAQHDAEQGDAAAAPEPRQEAIKAAYLKDRGFIPGPIEGFLRIDPEFVDAYRRISSLPFQDGGLSRKDAELVVVALDASVNHLHAIGCQAHIQAALHAGASVMEVAEVLELSAAMAAQGAALGLRIAAGVFSDRDEP